MTLPASTGRGRLTLRQNDHSTSRRPLRNAKECICAANAAAPSQPGPARHTARCSIAACCPSCLAGISRISTWHPSLVRSCFEPIEHCSECVVWHGRIFAILESPDNAGRHTQLTRKLVDTHPERQTARPNFFRGHGVDRVTRQFYASSPETSALPCGWRALSAPRIRQPDLP